ncbi:hypothetical protein SAMN05216390_11441 [Lachnospiraceae bacterium KH1T2]|nr:hypothetical protein SAMN05216390_11441 [Lachnospiraceae bacterium KH1T2]
MKNALYALVELIARVHDKLESLNDSYEYNFNDYQLHFIVIGILGMLLTFMLIPLVKWLVKRKKVLTITWIYVFTVLIVITFAIEIGQGFTHTGTMDFSDIVFGIMGFIIFFAIYAVIRGVILLLTKMIFHRNENDD